MRMPSTSTLLNIAIGGGFVSIVGVTYFQSRIQSNFRQQEYYKKSIELLNGYEPAIKALGPPIQLKYLHLWDGSTWSTGFQAQLKIPLKGQNEKGALHVWASRKDVHDSWNIDRLDVEVGKSQALTFYKSTRNDLQPADSAKDDVASQDLSYGAAVANETENN
ncbi:hypothetical protein HELRODRAFT_178754 [Helobdella robusta]|uniref:Cytochrome c oxidase assembly factor 1 homolog n=1 Tax=Helobdella robusta TaxID=6412 RepID=T1FDP0_HELRO|nr:hypothetical protein HELRODRAFT_178754 [Helobdella robusta]ESN96953.1 hypothetical protein HELRODRAFT_178754 [Helobdella robusta]